MSKARLTAVVTEGRSQGDLARAYGGAAYVPVPELSVSMLNLILPRDHADGPQPDLEAQQKETM